MGDFVKIPAISIHKIRIQVREKLYVGAQCLPNKVQITYEYRRNKLTRAYFRLRNSKATSIPHYTTSHQPPPSPQPTDFFSYYGQGCDGTSYEPMYLRIIDNYRDTTSDATISRLCQNVLIVYYSDGPMIVISGLPVVVEIQKWNSYTRFVITDIDINMQTVILINCNHDNAVYYYRRSYIVASSSTNTYPTIQCSQTPCLCEPAIFVTSCTHNNLPLGYTCVAARDTLCNMYGMQLCMYKMNCVKKFSISRCLVLTNTAHLFHCIVRHVHTQSTRKKKE